MSKRPKRNALKEIAEEMDVLDEMLATLVDLLEKKQVITRKEFEDLLRGKIEKIAKLKSYRDVQLGT
jgi:phage-related baseplate assembly protein